ncbi:class I SAM-dependent methyltransferase [uncultured Ruminococcus sp.]|uniref:class I SAM-dependent methyltransferase n=1 Tax=uncultured Ruminococcus sp. TaxID=165186 RepID=UPI002931117D|nr:class I SAM-dependent methyltransferase [uncultured Ruminococcus sp.]
MKLSYIDNANDFDFGKTAENYARFRDIYPESMYEKLIERGIGKEGQQILDLGSGTAILPMNLYHTGAYFTATDIAENQITVGRELARQKGMERIAFKVCPAEDTGFDDHAFDAVTAVQCFPYFDADGAAAEIFRVLKPQGLFCKILMDWLPREDAVVAEMIALVQAYNPAWNPEGFREYDYHFPDWAQGRFDSEAVISYDEALAFTKEAWLGRALTCRGVGASLPPEKVREFEAEYRRILARYGEPLYLKHRIHIELYRSIK